MPKWDRIAFSIVFVIGVAVGACVAGAIATSEECGHDYQPQTYSPP
jgi:hypothetical protein